MVRDRGQRSRVSDLNRKAYSCRTTHRKQTITHHLQRRQIPNQRVCVSVSVITPTDTQVRINTHTARRGHRGDRGSDHLASTEASNYLLKGYSSIMHTLFASYSEPFKIYCQTQIFILLKCLLKHLFVTWWNIWTEIKLPTLQLMAKLLYNLYDLTQKLME